MTTFYRIRPWIDPEKLVWSRLSANPSPGALTMLLARPERIHWGWLSANPHPAAVVLLRTNVGKVGWYNLASNPNPDAVALLAAYPCHINWGVLSQNPSDAAIDILAANPRKADWYHMMKNANPRAVDIIGPSGKLRQKRPRAPSPPFDPSNVIDADDGSNPEKTHYTWLSACAHDDPAVVCKMASRTHRLAPEHWDALSANPAIFEEFYDYAAIRAAMDPHREALAAAAFHPRRLARHLALGGAPDDW